MICYVAELASKLGQFANTPDFVTCHCMTSKSESLRLSISGVTSPGVAALVKWPMVIRYALSFMYDLFLNSIKSTA